MDDADVLRGVLAAYKTVMEASWPHLHPAMKERASGWATAGADKLQAELQEYLQASAESDQHVRVFWKVGTQFKFGGVNQLFARDAGFSNPADLVGLDDFDRRLPWTHQAAKYRQDDEEVYKSGQPKLDILERQQSKTGITWVRAGKAPIRKPNRDVVGILGMYELLDAETGRKLFAERNLQKRK
ncbi:MAG TPA: hypothetical protein VL549_07570 [Gemmatimonadales bacterium]|nr:hypothetical protein [Gemmatimonadales bacterium]